MTGATTVVLEHDPAESQWVIDQLSDATFTDQLRETYATVAVDDTLTGSIEVGGCGDELNVDLRVKDVSGGRDIDRDTEFRIVPRS
ncbi:MAG: hypothetical protein ABEJ44_07915 [Halanaeroarchaeum sp.]